MLSLPLTRYQSPVQLAPAGTLLVEHTHTCNYFQSDCSECPVYPLSVSQHHSQSASAHLNPLSSVLVCFQAVGRSMCVCVCERKREREREREGEGERERERERERTYNMSRYMYNYACRKKNARPRTLVWTHCKYPEVDMFLMPYTCSTHTHTINSH